MPTVAEKNANMDVCVFFYLADPNNGAGSAPPPFEALMHGFENGTTGETTERREWREQTPPIVFWGWEARRRGRG